MNAEQTASWQANKNWVLGTNLFLTIGDRHIVDFSLLVKQALISSGNQLVSLDREWFFVFSSNQGGKEVGTFRFGCDGCASIGSGALG